MLLPTLTIPTFLNRNAQDTNYPGGDLNQEIPRKRCNIRGCGITRTLARHQNDIKATSKRHQSHGKETSQSDINADVKSDIHADIKATSRQNQSDITEQQSTRPLYNSLSYAPEGQGYSISQSDVKATSKRLQSDIKATSKRHQSKCKAAKKKHQNDIKAISKCSGRPTSKRHQSWSIARNYLQNRTLQPRTRLEHRQESAKLHAPA